MKVLSATPLSLAVVGIGHTPSFVIVAHFALVTKPFLVTSSPLFICPSAVGCAGNFMFFIAVVKTISGCFDGAHAVFAGFRQQFQFVGLYGLLFLHGSQKPLASSFFRVVA